MSDEGFRSGQRAESLLVAPANEPYVLWFIREHPVLTHFLIVAMACLVVAVLRGAPSGFGG
jgi:hypothetical protein